MKKVITSIMVLTTTLATVASGQNPLLATPDTPHQTPVFTAIELDHYMPAFEEGIAQNRAEIDRIVNNSEAPTFENTVEALERSGRLLDNVATIFFVLNSSATSDRMQELANEISPMLTDLSNDIMLDPQLFERIKTVYDARAERDYTPEQAMLLEKTYKSFSRQGAALSDEDKDKFRAISSELGLLTLKFAQNTLAETNAYSLNIPADQAHRIDYMPGFVIDAMAQEAQARGEQGWTVTLQAPSFIPFLTYSRERDLKEQLWRALNTVSYNDSPTGNIDNVRRIAELRMEMARLLGYETYADYVLEERMAASRSNVNEFLDELLASTIGWARQEYDEVVNYAAANGGPATEEFMPWDFGYWSDQYKNSLYDFNEELLKPYLKLDNVERGVFELANRLYGIRLVENKQIDVYHPDVKAFEVFDANDRFLAVLYMDYFPRASKRAGAWMTNFRDMYTTEDGTEVRPLVTLNFNFTKPTADAPSLLTFDELETFLHEFGHGLHGIFAEGSYGSLTGTSVYRDFVELPSQILENWAAEKDFLDLFAVHYQTGEPIPADLVQKIVDSQNYLAAYSNVRQLTYALNDMSWHTITQPVTIDPATFEKQATERTRITPAIDGTCMSTAFGHIFAGGYAAGYYGYKWAEVLEADAYSMFEENGIFDRTTAQAFRDNILSMGGTEHPMTLYVNFRGHRPETSALVRKIAGERLD